MRDSFIQNHRTIRPIEFLATMSLTFTFCWLGAGRRPVEPGGSTHLSRFHLYRGIPLKSESMSEISQGHHLSVQKPGTKLAGAYRWFQNRDWLPMSSIIYSKFSNSEGACPGFEMQRKCVICP
jgi:hypothetical protein